MRRRLLAPAVLPLLLASCGGPDQPARTASIATCGETTAPTTSTSASATLWPGSAVAPTLPDSDEGMWLLEEFPSERVGKLHGFAPTQPWLDHVRLSSVRLAFGCSGSFVSSTGLVMTNHHCAEQCIEQLSTAKKDFVASGFSAKTEKDEVKCPEIEVDQLVEITDVTARVLAAMKGQDAKGRNEAQKAEFSRIEKECGTGDKIRCDVVDLYHGGKFHLYKYRRYQDTRLVFAPEMAIAFFGGDPDNFMFPRFDLDVSYLRVYDEGKPAKTENFFGWSKAGVKPDDLTFVSGHPGRTSRLLTVAQLEYERDVRLPEVNLRRAELRGVLTDFGLRGKEQARISKGYLFDIENALKARRGMHKALLDKEFFDLKIAEEKALRAKVDASPELKAEIGGAWNAIAAAQKERRAIDPSRDMLERGEGFDSELFHIARDLLRLGDELTKPNEKRLREYADSNLPAVKQRLLSTAPIYDELETLTLGASLVKLREELGPDHLVVKKVLGKESPQALAASVIKGSKLRDLKVRKALLEGGKKAVDASKDPMIELARLVDPDARAIRTLFEDKIEAVEKANGELIAKARFKVWGASVYPDATFTLRLSYGKVAGWEEPGKVVSPITTFGGAFARATGKDPFALPDSWLAVKDKLDMSTPFDFSTTNDIVGGNSGSPVIDKNGDIVGLIFDGNIHSLGGDYGFDPKLNRAVAVHSQALKIALEKVYGATRLVAELGH
jgi:hypothetical protein